MKYKPHEYQTYATDFILTHPASAIFLDCGLGKSVITLTAIRMLLEMSYAATAPKLRKKPRPSAACPLP